MTGAETTPIAWKTANSARTATGRRRLDATFEVMTAVLEGIDLTAALTLVAVRARSMAGARLAFIVMPLPETDLLRIDIAVGAGADRLRGQTFRSGRSIIGRAFRTRRAMSTQIAVGQALSDLPAGPILLLPLETGEATHGVLAVLGGPGERPLDTPTARELFRFATMSATLIGLAEEQRAAGPPR
ncbi:GAF domain-containing protein [Spirillospora sp. NPDC029432]|uniref:GAF domain-containing protein n=1 Tax=Spirillospora sp. NPDC029432 TaxID=3154599 RepID=UPI0034547127